jgi:hypothetical protein
LSSYTNSGGPKQGLGRLGLLESGASLNPWISTPSISTTGYENIQISFGWAMELDSATKVCNFVAQWSTNFTTWTNIAGTTYVKENDGMAKIITTVSVSSNDNVGNKPALWIRWYNYSNTGSGTRDKVSFDNVVITGSQISGGAVDVSISPSENSGFPENTLTYTVVTKNVGTISDNYVLAVSEDENWGPTLDENQFLNVGPGENRTTTLSVTIPVDAADGATDIITVTATSQEDENIKDNATCITTCYYSVPSSVIVSGQSNEYNSDLTDGPPWKLYPIGSLPPMMAAKRVGSGAVVAAGTAATCRNTRWVSGEYDVLLEKAFQWMVPGAENVLWYEGHGVYNDYSQCSTLIDALVANGYNVSNLSDEPIDSALLAPYDILVIPQLEVGSVGTGGDPNLLADSEVEAIKNFVEGGKGLLIMDESDYGGNNFYKVQNKILEALNMNVWFQSDEIMPNSYGYFTANVSDNLFGADYRTEAGKTTIQLYDVCSITDVPPNYPIVTISPLGRSGEPRENLAYTVTIKNAGKNDDNYTLQVATDNNLWVASITPSFVSAAAGEENTAILSIKIPDNATPGSLTYATVTATSQINENINGTDNVGEEVPEEPILREWTTASKLFPGTPDYGVTVGSAGENIYITNTSQFVRYNTAMGWWEDLAVPGMFANGSYLVWDGGNYIYVLTGGSYSMCIDPSRHNNKFYRYDIANDSWTRMADTPWYQGPGDALTLAKIGGDNYIFAFLGTSSSAGNPNGWAYYPDGVEFWRYNIATNTWDENLTRNPYGADDGASLVWTGGDNIYAFPGAYDESLPKDNERFFLRYSISGDNWVQLENTPYHANGGVDDGGSLAYPGSGDNIYALKGGDDTGGGGSSPGDLFWGYSIPDDNWTTLQNIPAGVGDNNGHRLGVVGGNIYCWRGSFGDGTLWVYSLSARNVDVSISPGYENGAPGETIEYTVTVKNTGSDNDNYKLENTDTKGWALALSKNLIENIVPGENENVTLTVTIPENAVYSTNDVITVTATSLVDPGVHNSGSCVANQGLFIKENVPDLGQHAENWCWTAAAANIFKWYFHNGYPELMNDPTDNVLDENYLQLLSMAGDNFPRLLNEIAKDSLFLGTPENAENAITLGMTWNMPIDDNRYFYGLQEFIDEQGVLLRVHDILNPDNIIGSVPPENAGIVVYDNVTFDDYKNELMLENCQVLLQLNFMNYSYESGSSEALDHIVTGVAYFDGGTGNQWIQVADPWTPLPGPDHNNIEENYTYDNLQVVSDDPLTVMYTGYTSGGPVTVPVEVVNLIYILPITSSTGTASIRMSGTGSLSPPFLWGISKANVSVSLQVPQGDSLRLIFLAQDNHTVESDNVIWSRTAPGLENVTLTNLVVPHDNNLTWPAGGSPSISLAKPANTIKRVKLVLTDSSGNIILDNMAWYRIVQDDWSNRISWIILKWGSHNSSQQDQLSNEISSIIIGWGSVPTTRDQHDFLVV